MSEEIKPAASEQDLEALVKRMVQENQTELFKNHPELARQSQPVPEPQPFRLNIGGRDVEFKNPTEAQNYINQYQAEMNGRLEESTRNAALANNPDPRTKTDGTDIPNQPRVDPVKFATLLVEDPIAAMEWLDEARYGFKPTQVLPKALEITAKHDREIQTDRFMRENPDYSPSDANAQAMFQLMQQYNIPWTSQGLALAYAKGRQDGVFETAKGQNDAEDDFQRQVDDLRTQQTVRRNPPSVGTRSSAQPEADFAAMAEDLTKEQILELASRFNVPIR